VIAWTHGTTGVAEDYAPSLLRNPFTAGALFVLPQILAQGWVLVATDYTGMGTKGPSPFLIGQGEARSALDAVRAARQLTPLNLADQTVISRRAASRCLSGPGVLVSVAQSLVLDKPIFTGNPATGALGQRLIQNTPARDVQAPLLIAQGLADPLVLPSVQAQYIRQRCAAGQKLDYLTYPGRGHVGLVAADSPLIPALTSWTKDRLARKPAPDNCATS
jgi:hypothetical protein